MAAQPYVRRYVSELADVQAPQIFAPWWDLDLLEMTGYPAPILEVPSTTPKASRSDALTLPL